MKALILLAAAAGLSSSLAVASGTCTNDEYNPHMAQLCANQGKYGGKSTCKMTRGCRWISNNDNGACTHDRDNPHMAGICKLQGYPFCVITRGCAWIDLD